MTARPIIFSAPMVGALLAGRKTMTRRLTTSPLRRIEAGDRLWVREGFRLGMGYDGARVPHAGTGVVRVWYEADIEHYRPGARGYKKRPSIHMPRWASRLTLTVTERRVERLQDISHADAVAEGMAPFPNDAVCCFSELWDELHGVDAWDANPEVVAIRFIVERRNVDDLRVVTKEISAAQLGRDLVTGTISLAEKAQETAASEPSPASPPD